MPSLLAIYIIVIEQQVLAGVHANKCNACS